MKKEKEITVNYGQEDVFNFLRNGNNYVSKSLEDDVKLNKSGTAANARIPGLGIIRVDLKTVDNHTVKVYSKEIGTTITAKLSSISEDKTNVKFTIDCLPDCGLVKNGIIVLAMPKVMDIMISELKKAVIKN